MLRISRLGHRNRILAAIGSLPFDASVPSSASTCQVNDDQHGWAASSSKVDLVNVVTALFGGTVTAQCCLAWHSAVVESEHVDECNE